MDEDARRLSLYLGEHVWAVGFEILRDAARCGPSLMFVQFCTDLRYVRRHIHSFEELRLALLERPHPIWLNTFAQQVFHAWRVMHARACPTVARPEISGIQLSRLGRCLLARVGMVHAQETTLASQADAIITHIWEWMSNHQVALCIDNYRHARRSLGPARVDITLDYTAIAIVTITKPPRLPTYGGHPVVRTLLSKVGTTAAEVVVRLQRLHEFIEFLNESPVERTMIRAPLDVMRPDATTQRLQPLMLSAQKPGTLAELLDVCGMLCRLQRHTRNTLTILCDMKFTMH